MKPFDLPVSEFTLIQLVIDTSGSATDHRQGLEHVIKEVVRSCLHSDRKNSFILRIVTAGTKPFEVHGFKLLTDCEPGEYECVLGCGGTTALNDATLDGIEAVADLGRHLTQNDYLVNGVIVVLTDGLDNRSNAGPAEVGSALSRAAQTGSLESLTSILIGIVGVSDRNSLAHKEVSGALRRFRNKVGFTDYMQLDVLNDGELKSLTKFVCTSIQAVANSLGHGHLPPLPAPPSTGEILRVPSVARISGMSKKKGEGKTDKNLDVEAAFPNITRWVRGGWIEIGDQGWRGFAARALDEGGVIYEKERCRTLAEAMDVLESGLRKWFDENGR